MMNELIGMGIFLLIIAIPLVLIILDFIFYLKKKQKGIFEFIAFFIGSVYFLLGYSLWALPSYDIALNKYGMERAHEPFSSEHVITLIVLILVGFFSYMILKFGRRVLPPLAEVILLGGALLGAVVNVICMIQLACGARPDGLSLYGNDYVFIVCFCTVPILFLCHLIELMVKLVKEKAEKQATLNYANPVMQRLNSWFLKGANLFWVALVAMIPIFIILMMILCLFGQQPNSVILAFTKTSDWILSMEVAPPPVEVDAHYLCTVSLRGHKKLLKPLRFGVRKGNKIMVNRQLCVANAFEQLLMEKTPRFHKAVRHFYDTYGYPVSKHINSAWSADLTYLIMKPLEWIFAFVLYLLDQEPETRICSQYLPAQSFKEDAK